MALLLFIILALIVGFWSAVGIVLKIVFAILFLVGLITLYAIGSEKSKS